MRQLLLLAITIFMVVALTACDQKNDSKRKKAKGNLVMVSSVSSDGKYAITTNMNEQAYLWDLENHSYKPLSKDPVNIYSAYFIKNSHNFIYQLNSTNDVIVQNTSGKVIKKFNPGFPSYGQVITKDLKNYFAADEDLNMFKLSVATNQLKQLTISWCMGDHKGELYHGPLPTICTSFGGYGKLLNLAFTPSEETLIGTGDSTIWIWDVAISKTKMIEQTNDQTVNAISPDGKYVVVADQQENGFVYDLVTQKIAGTETDDTFFFKEPETNELTKNYFKEGNRANVITSVRFIDKNHYIISYDGSPDPFMYLGLFELHDYWYKTVGNSKIPITSPIKYLPLSKEILKNADDPYPETKSFVRDQAMDTSPSAHVLVMGQANGGGIMVYRYDPDTQELKLDWAPMLPVE